jgi:hypothetical protein
MVVYIKHNSMETEPTADNIMEEGEETVITPASATNNEPIKPVMKEFSILYQLLVQRGQSIDDHLRLHPQLLQALTTTFDEMELRIINNNNQRVNQFHDPKWSEKQYYDDQFNHHVDILKRQIVIAHRFQSIHTILYLKSAPLVLDFLKTNTSRTTPNHTNARTATTIDTTTMTTEATPPA